MFGFAFPNALTSIIYLITNISLAQLTEASAGQSLFGDLANGLAGEWYVVCLNNDHHQEPLKVSEWVGVKALRGCPPFQRSEAAEVVLRPSGNHK